MYGRGCGVCGGVGCGGVVSGSVGVCGMGVCVYRDAMTISELTYSKECPH